ncbi:MAG: energy transducer TonB [Bacteroidales bacterium]|nr:energy transducer TonB [Bacteroidales bacterium]
MKRGKQTCRILKEIRKQIADANDIEFITSECQFKGDCLGTCPKCESEVHYLEQQLKHRQMLGKAITLFGLSAGAIALNAAEHVTVEPNINTGMRTEQMNNMRANSVEETVLIGNTITPKPKLNKKKKSKEATDSEDTTLMGMVEQQPSFPGGQAVMMEWIANHLRYPKQYVEGGVTGKVIVQFTVDIKGRTRDAVIARSLDSLCDREAIRLVLSMPRWNPGTLNGKKLPVKYTLPISFKY